MDICLWLACFFTLFSNTYVIFSPQTKHLLYILCRRWKCGQQNAFLSLQRLPICSFSSSVSTPLFSLEKRVWHIQIENICCVNNQEICCLFRSVSRNLYWRADSIFPNFYGVWPIWNGRVCRFLDCEARGKCCSIPYVSITSHVYLWRMCEFVYPLLAISLLFSHPPSHSTLA